MTRHISNKLKFKKPACIHSKFIPNITGESGKMSASIEQSCIYLTDTPKQIQTKINKFAFSGGKENIEEHRKHGADLSVDVAWIYLNFFMEDDDRLKQIGEDYAAGRMLTSEIKKELADCLIKVIDSIKVNREKLTDEEVNKFFSRDKRLFMGK